MIFSFRKFCFAQPIFKIRIAEQALSGVFVILGTCDNKVFTILRKKVFE